MPDRPRSVARGCFAPGVLPSEATSFFMFVVSWHERHLQRLVRVQEIITAVECAQERIPPSRRGGFAWRRSCSPPRRRSEAERGRACRNSARTGARLEMDLMGVGGEDHQIPGTAPRCENQQGVSGDAATRSRRAGRSARARRKNPPGDGESEKRHAACVAWRRRWSAGDARPRRERSGWTPRHRS